ncbi:MAG: hypothetical protein ACXWQO_09395, partial [Bdellovibrionota bacterium]
KRFIFSQEALHPADAGVSRELLPYINYFELITKFGGEKLMGQQDIWLVIIKNGKADIKAPLMLQIDQRYPEPANCSLYTQASISGALVSAYQFKLGSQRNNTIKLHPDYRKYFISVVCAQSRGLLVSNLLTPDVQTINNQ